MTRTPPSSPLLDLCRERLPDTFIRTVVRVAGNDILRCRPAWADSVLVVASGHVALCGSAGGAVHLQPGDVFTTRALGPAASLRSSDGRPAVVVAIRRSSPAISTRPAHPSPRSIRWI